MDAPDRDAAPALGSGAPLPSGPPPASPETAPADQAPAAPTPPAGPAPAPPPVAAGWPVRASAAPSGWRLTRTETRRRTFWLILLVIVLVPVAAVLVALLLAGREVGTIASFSDDTDGQITHASVRSIGGRMQWELFAAPDFDEADGARLACEVVRPVFARHGINGAEFYVIDQAGDVIGSWHTSCAPPKPVVPAA